MTLLDEIREIGSLAQVISDELQTAERPSVESVGIAWVHSEAILDLVDRLERDLLFDDLVLKKGTA